MSDIDVFDAVYRERAHLVAWLATLHPSVIAPAPDLTDDDAPGWQIVYVTAGGRQMSWHISPLDAGLFEHVEHVDPDDPRAQWDGHTTEAKYQRIAELTAELAQRCDTERGEQPIGDVLDGLGITADIEPDALVAGAIVLLKTLLPNGDVRLSIAFSEGLGWIERAGMLHLASAMETSTITETREPGA